MDSPASRQATLRQIKFPTPPSADDDPVGGLTFSAMAELEDRERRGELNPEDASLLAAGRERMHGAVSTPLRRVVESVSRSLGATLQDWAERNRDVNAWVESLPARRREMYGHMTMPELRRVMCSELSVRPLARRRGEHGRAHRRRPAARRAGGSRSGTDPGDAGSDGPGEAGPHNTRQLLELVAGTVPAWASLDAWESLAERLDGRRSA